MLVGGLCFNMTGFPNLDLKIQHTQCCGAYIYIYIYITLDHKTSHKGQFLEIDKLSIDVWFVRIRQYSQLFENLRVQKY